MDNHTASEDLSEPLIDYSKDKDVIQTGKVSDLDAMTQNWTDGKVAGELLDFVICVAPSADFLLFIVAYDAYRRTSLAYKHFDARLVRVPAKGSEVAYFEYIYTCAGGHDGCHHTQRQSNQPTTKLSNKAKACDKKHGDSAPQPKQKDLHETITAYDKYHHRMLIAMWCAVSNRPFISVEDHYYKLEVEHLRSGASFANILATTIFLTSLSLPRYLPSNPKAGQCRHEDTSDFCCTQTQSSHRGKYSFPAVPLMLISPSLLL